MKVLLQIVLLLGILHYAGSSAPSAIIGCNAATCSVHGQQCCMNVQCFDPQYQTCCSSGVACNTNYEVCCNGTCCNKYTARCKKVDVLGGTADVCTSTNWLSPERGFLVVGIPIITILMAFLLILVMINRIQQAPHLFRIQIAIIFVAFYGIVVGAMLVFSPMWFNGVLTILFSIAAIGGAIVLAPFPIGGALIIQHVLLLLYTNPYAPNWPLSFGSSTPGGWISEMEVMIQDTDYTTSFASVSSARCTMFYNSFFLWDSGLRDPRIDNPQQIMWGFCGREWLTALYIVMLVQICAIVVLHVLLVIQFAQISPWFVNRTTVTVVAVDRVIEERK